MWIILQLLFLLSPEQKSLVAMARQGDMIAADQLAAEVCAMPGEARQKAAKQIRKRVKGKKSKAVEMLTTGLDRCAPVGQGTAAQAVKVQPVKKNETPRRRGLSGRMVMIPGSQTADDSGKSSASRGRRRPISAETTTSDKAKTTKVATAKKRDVEKPVKKQNVKKTADEKRPVAQSASVKKNASTIVRRPEKKVATNERRVHRAARRAKNVASLDSLPDGDVDPPADTGARDKLDGRRDDASEQNLPDLEPLDSPLASSQVQTRPSRLADVDRHERLSHAMTFYGLGGGFAAVATVSYVGALIALGTGAFQQMQLKVPAADSQLTTPDGRTEQDVYDAQLAAIWTSAGIMSAIAAVTATAELIAGFVLFAQGDSALEDAN